MGITPDYGLYSNPDENGFIYCNHKAGIRSGTFAET